MKNRGWRALLVALWLVACFSAPAQAAPTPDETSVTELEEALAQVMPHADSPFFFQQLLGRIARHLLARPHVSREAGVRFLRRAQKTFPGLLQFTVLDAAGTPVPEWCDSVPPRAILRRLHGVMQNLDQGIAEPLMKHWNMLRPFFGPDAAFGRIVREKLFQVSFRDDKTWVFLSRQYPGGMLICHLNRVPHWKTLALRHAIKRWNARRPAVRLGIADLHSRQIDGFSGTDIPSREIWSVLREFERFPEPVIRRFQAIWTQRIADDHLRVLARRALPEPDPDREHSGVWIFALLLFPPGLLALLFHRRLRLVAGNLPIAWKLTIVYLSVAVLSLVILGFGGRRFLQERREALETRRFQVLERALLVFDRRSPIMLREVEASLKKVFTQPIPDGAPRDSFVQSLLQQLTRQFHPIRLCLLTRTGEIVMPTGFSVGLSGVERLQGTKKPLSSFLRLINNPDPVEVRSLRADIAGLAVKISVDDVVAELRQSFGQFRITDLGPAGLEFHVNFPLYERNGRCLGAVFLDFSADQLQTAYLKKYLARFARSLAGSQVFAFHLRDKTRRFSIGAPRHTGILPFHRRVAGSPTTRREVRPHGSRPSMLVGLKGKHLSEYSLLLQSPIADIEHEVSQIRHRLIAYGLCLLFVSLIVTHLLARHVLQPVGNLQAGIHALEQRRFDHRVPVENPDEFGNLSIAFNAMMEDMADLEVAKVVQETLFPVQPITLGAFTIFGHCVPAAQVGGDYYDYRPLDEQRLLFFLGDVAGHGISAAIVMAMAKGVFEFAGFSAGTAAGMTELNDVLTQGAKRRKMMTALLGILDSRTGTVDIANAGQVNPLLIRNGEARFLESSGKPLGVSRRFVPTPMQLILEPGDLVVFMTDGVPEATNTRGEPLGYERFRAILPSLVTSDLLATEARIRAWHKAWSGRDTPEDDVSILLLTRLPTAPAGGLPHD